MITMKFGGSSVASPEKMKHCAELVQEFFDEQPYVVVSAMGGVTDLLLDMADAAVAGKREQVDENLELIRDKHYVVLEANATDPELRQKAREELDPLLEEMKNILHGVLLLKECSPRSSDMIVSFGERMSVIMLSATLQGMGLDAGWVDARDMVRTDNNFTSAIVDLNTTRDLCQTWSHAWPKGKIPVFTGFIARNKEGITTTIGRNGTDYTATIIGFALGAREVWIWKDVDGVMTADPRNYPAAKVVPQISYAEAAEISHFGGEVIHPKTMQPAVLVDIPVRVKNTFNPEYPGTMISSKADPTADSIITSSIKNLALITVEGTGLQASPQVPIHVLSVVARENIKIYMISMASSDYNISFLVQEKDAEHAEAILKKELAVFQEIEHTINPVVVERGVAVIACVGANLRGRVGVAGKIFMTLGDAGINMIAIAQGSSEYNISIVVRDEQTKKAVSAIHDKLDGTLS
jgi:bifunctional aspartokinase / homoserine dehydrogenase 1